MHENLSRFIDAARAKGMDSQTLFLLLRSSGWKEREIADALAARELAMSIPERAGVGTARDAFFHLLAFTALYAWAISLILLLFTFIDFAFPDPSRRGSTYQLEAALAGVRVALATLLVAFPVFIAVWWFLLREVWRFPEKAKSGVRRWLASLTLFVGAVTIGSDVIAVVYRLVEGDLTVRFLLKVGVLLAIAAALFVYLALTLRSEGEAAK